MVTYTTTYSLAKPSVAGDEDVWGGYLNGNFDTLENLLKGTTSLTSLSLSGDITFGDDNKVIFGAGSDLQIYHNSAIGKSIIYAFNNDLVLRSQNGTDAIIASNGGAAKLNYTGSEKLATTSTGIDVTGNITVSGTVDGRDVATDGAKLDGIESGATADQTKADIDALGIAASTAATLATARNIALTGAVTGNVNFDGSGNVSIATTATSDPTLTLNGDVSGSATFTNLGNATLTVTVADDSHNHVISNVDGLQTALDGKQASLGFTPVQQGGGTGQLTNKIYQGWSGSNLLLQVDSTNFGSTWPISVNGNASNITSYTINQSVGTANSPSFAGLNINGNLNAVDHIYLAGNIYHEGDTNTYIAYTADTINLVTGGGSEFLVGSNYVRVVDAALQEDYDALSGTTPTCNVSTGGAFSLTMTGNTTFTFSGAVANWSQGFVLQLTGNGGTVTWPASVDWAGGTAPDAPASGETDIYVFWTRDGGTTWYGVQSIDAAA